MNRPMGLRRAGILSARITANPDLARKANRSRKYDFAGKRLYLGSSWLVVNVLLLGHAVLSDGRGEIASEIAFAGAATVSTVCLVWWAVKNYFARRPSVDANAEAELAERTARWSAAAERMRELKKRYADAQRLHQRRDDIQREMRALQHAMLAGEV